MSEEPPVVSFAGTGEAPLPSTVVEAPPPDDFIRLAAGTPDSPGEPAIFEDPRPRPVRMHQRFRCHSCYRADVEGNRLRLVLLARDGLLFEVCQLCYLVSEVRDLATGGRISHEVLDHTERQLSELYALLRLNLEENIEAARNGSGSQGEGQGSGSSR